MTGAQVFRLTMVAFGALAVVALAIGLAPARAHDQWANGEPVPAWVKRACCGPSDVHHLRDDQVRIASDGYHVDGLGTAIPFAKSLPSPDGTYWGFWSPYMTENPTVYCFFTPAGAT